MLLVKRWGGRTKDVNRNLRARPQKGHGNQAHNSGIGHLWFRGEQVSRQSLFDRVSYQLPGVHGRDLRRRHMYADHPSRSSQDGLAPFRWYAQVQRNCRLCLSHLLAMEEYPRMRQRERLYGEHSYFQLCWWRYSYMKGCSRHRNAGIVNKLAGQLRQCRKA